MIFKLINKSRKISILLFYNQFLKGLSRFFVICWWVWKSFSSRYNDDIRKVKSGIETVIRILVWTGDDVVVGECRPQIFFTFRFFVEKIGVTFSETFKNWLQKIKVEHRFFRQKNRNLKMMKLKILYLEIFVDVPGISQ